MKDCNFRNVAGWQNKTDFVQAAIVWNTDFFYHSRGSAEKGTSVEMGYTVQNPSLAFL